MCEGNPGEIDFGSSYWESTVLQKLQQLAKVAIYTVVAMEVLASQTKYFYEKKEKNCWYLFLTYFFIHLGEERKWSKIPYLRKQHDVQDLNTRPPDVEFELLTALPQMPLIAIHCRYFKIMCLKCTLPWNPINTVTNGPKNLTVFMGDLINKVFFTRKRRVVLPGAKKVAMIAM